MASQDHHITKDVTARKNTKPPTMHTTLEMAAIKASHEAYVNSMVQGYNAEIEGLEAAHTEEFAALKASYEAATAEVKAQAETDGKAVHEKERATFNRGYAMARHECNAEIAKLSSDKMELEKNRNYLQSTLDNVLAKNKDEDVQKNNELNRVYHRVNKLKREHESRMTLLQKRMIYEVKFEGKQRKPRSYFRNPELPFKDVATELLKDISLGYDDLTFSHKSRLISNPAKNLLELSIESGDSIIYTKK